MFDFNIYKLPKEAARVEPKIICTVNTILVVNNMGDVYGFGENVAGELGTGDNIKKDGLFPMAKLPGQDEYVTHIASNYNTTVIASSHNKIYVCGWVFS